MTARAGARASLAALLLALGLPAAALPQGTTVGAGTAHAIADRDQVAVLEVVGNYDQNLPAGDINADPREAVAQEFFKSHPDEYDFLIVWSTFEFNTKEARAFYSGSATTCRASACRPSTTATSSAAATSSRATSTWPPCRGGPTIR